MPHVPSVSLRDGTTIPQLGFGVWQVDDDVAEALGLPVVGGLGHHRGLPAALAQGVAPTERVPRFAKECRRLLQEFLR